jgi:hypothetical protein
MVIQALNEEDSSRQGDTDQLGNRKVKNGNGKSPMYREHKPEDTSLSECGSLETPTATSPNRIKKSRLERDTHRQRGRTRSNTRATASTNAPLTQ